MFCKNCGNQLNTTSKFCPGCGQQVLTITSQQSEIYRPQAKLVNQPTYDTVCQTCGVHAPVKYVEFYQNIGMLFRRQQRSIKGKLCKKCINKYFKKFTLVNLTLGWWGMISFFATAFFLVNNTFRYLTVLSLKKPNA